MKFSEVSGKIKEAVNAIFKSDKAKEVLEKLEVAASQSSNSFWWEKFVALVNVIIVEVEDDDRELSGESKKILVEKVLGPIWDEYMPSKIKTLNTLSFGYLKKVLFNFVIDGLVLAYNMTFGKKWVKVAELDTKTEEK